MEHVGLSLLFSFVGMELRLGIRTLGRLCMGMELGTVMGLAPLLGLELGLGAFMVLVMGWTSMVSASRTWSRMGWWSPRMASDIIRRLSSAHTFWRI